MSLQPLLAEHTVHPLEHRIRSAGHVLIFSDFDGTLVPICESPLSVVLPESVRQLLSTLAKMPQVEVAVISGRDLTDLIPRIGVTGISYAGNHGLEITTPHRRFIESTAVARSAELTRLVAELVGALADVPGAWVQDKGLTASVHYRQVEIELVDRVLQTVERVIHPARDRFVLRSGKMVCEIRPAVDWNKGQAVRWLTESLAGGHPNPLTIYFGDDQTDEDAFKALPDGITVLVGRRESTAARYQVESPDDAIMLLRRLVTILNA